jgi:hypothetical protein
MENVFQELINFADRAKSIRQNEEDYKLPNLVFAYLLDSYFDRARRLEVFIETSDPFGEEDSQSWYDIVHIRVLDAEKWEKGLCIPLPLLRSDVIATLMKRQIPFVCPMRHDRLPSEPPMPDELKKLWDLCKERMSTSEYWSLEQIEKKYLTKYR